MSAVKLGARVKLTQALVREQGRESHPQFGTHWSKMWRTRPLKAPVEGIIVGRRTLNQGFNEWIGNDEGITFVITDRFQAVLVAFDMRRKPVPVLEEDLIFVEESA